MPQERRRADRAWHCRSSRTTIPIEAAPRRSGTPSTRCNRLGITLDYSTHLAAFWVNHCVVGQLPFGGTPNEAFEGAILEFAAVDHLPLIDPSLYTAYWDNLLVFGFPRCR